MARTKLIAKYAALDTSDLDQRIYDMISNYIVENGVEELPYLQVNGRWTGRISIAGGGWFGDFDFLHPMLSLCRVERNGDVAADMAKIAERVADWRDSLHTPDEWDADLGIDDDNFDDIDFLSDDENDARDAEFDEELGDILHRDSD